MFTSAKCSYKRQSFNRYPRYFSSSGVNYSRNENFLSVRNENELTNTLIASNRVPLILNFTTRENELCDSVTGALTRVIWETDKHINMVDVEVDWFPDMNKIMSSYNVQTIPTLVAWKNFTILSQFSPKKGFSWDELTNWVEQNGDQ